MAAAMNGMVLHRGIIPYSGTFLVFTDYCRPAIRLAALMGERVIHVMTHDSIGLGEDGPTHQPVEHYASLRAIPNLWVMRPGDPNETAEAWRVALERRDGPVALLLSRQNVEVLDRSVVAPAAMLERGGYVLWDSGAEQPELIMIATGAEVPPTLEAARSLARDGASVRVVSMPCVELFEDQPGEYREQVLPRAVTSRLAIEPGATLGWWKWVGSEGDVHGLDRFGASAPGTTVLEKLGFNAEGIATRARALLDSRH
jgi:transketolase